MGDVAMTHFLGRLTRDPGHRKEGVDPVNFGLAVNTGPGGEASFFEAEVWSNLGAFVRERAHKGDRVYVAAVPYLSRWKGKEGDRKEVRFRVIAFEFAGDGPAQNGGGAAPAKDTPPPGGLSVAEIMDMVDG